MLTRSSSVYVLFWRWARWRLAIWMVKTSQMRFRKKLKRGASTLWSLHDSVEVIPLIMFNRKLYRFVPLSFAFFIEEETQSGRWSNFQCMKLLIINHFVRSRKVKRESMWSAPFPMTHSRHFIKYDNWAWQERGGYGSRQAKSRLHRWSMNPRYNRLWMEW